MNAEYDNAALEFLVYEFNDDEKTDINNKIKRKVKKNNLGEYNQEHIDYLREIKNTIKTEIEKYHKSKYYTQKHGESSNINDFDTEGMANDYSKKYEKISENVISTFIELAVYVYYLR